MNKSTARLDKKRWLILVMQILAGAASMLVYITNVWMVPMHETYGWDPGIISIQFTLVAASGIVANILADKLREIWGDRKLLIISGVGFAISIMLCSISASVWIFVLCAGVLASFFMFFIATSQVENVSELFPDKNGLALGLLFFGCESLKAIMAPIAMTLLEKYGISMSFIIQGIGYGAIIVIAGLIIETAPEKYQPQNWTPELLKAVDDKHEEKTLQEIDREATWKEIAFSPGFLVLCAMLFFTLTGPIGLTGNFVDMAINVLKTNQSTAAWLYTVFALSGSVGSVLSGILADKFGVMKSFAVMTTIMAIGFLTIPVIQGSAIYFMAVMIIAGFVYGSFNTVLAVSFIAGWGECNYGLTMGVFGICATVMNFVGPQMCVRLDANTFFLVGGIFTLIGVGLIFFVVKIINKQIGYKVLK